VVCR
jgi:hypothetical protein